MNSFKHSGDLGDIIYALPIIKSLFGGTLYLTPCQATREAMTPARFDALRPLLMEQEDIMDVKWHKGEKVNYDFTKFRRSYMNNQTLAESQRIDVLPLQTVDYSKPWINVPSFEKHNRPVIARSARYHNPEWETIWPDIVSRYPDALFVGTKEEHAAFEEKFGKVEYRHTPDLLELAKVIAGCSIFIGNQSCPYAIAEGLKVNSIQEVSPKAPDCIFPRKNAMHIKKASEWRASHPKPMILLALQLHPGDAQQALELTRLIVELEPRFRVDAEFGIVARFDVDSRIVEQLQSIASERFNTRVIRSLPGNRDTGWPNGCNALWRALMLQLAGLQGEPVRTKANAVLCFEPDCVPVRRDWVTALMEEWARVQAKGKRAYGSLLLEHEVPHLNGNAVFDRNLAKLVPSVQKEVFGSWDGAHSKVIIPIAENSPLIIQRYDNNDVVRAEDIEKIRAENPKCAMVHGFKSESAKKAVLELAKTGKL